MVMEYLRHRVCHLGSWKHAAGAFKYASASEEKGSPELGVSSAMETSRLPDKSHHFFLRSSPETSAMLSVPRHLATLGLCLVRVESLLFFSLCLP